MRIRTIAALELALIFPAGLFMLALAVRNLTPLPLEVTSTAQQVVAWYAARMWTLWVFLLALPFTVLVSGVAALWRTNRELGHAWRGLLRATTLAAGGILAIVVLHMMAN
jgi:hypothetical protein